MPNWLLAIILVAIGAAGGSLATNLHWQAKWDKHIAADAKAETKAVVKASDQKQAQVTAGNKVSAKATVTDRKVQDQITEVIKDVPKHVPPSSDPGRCVTYGFVRTIDAAILGVRPSELQLPAGKSDTDCSPLEASAVATGIVENVGIARQNAVQLNALIDYLGDQELILTPKEKTP